MSSAEIEPREPRTFGKRPPMRPMSSIPVPVAPEAWELARRLIEHEDTLINHRMTHYLTTQGFLFAAMGLLANAGISSSKGLFLWLALVASTVAVLTGLVALHSIRAAHHQIKFVSDWWYAKHRDVSAEAHERNRASMEDWPGSYPRIIGHMTAGAAIHWLVIVLSASWLAIIGLLIRAFSMTHQLF